MSTAKRHFTRSSTAKTELDLSEATEEILLQIFPRVDEKVLVKNCTRVSPLWHQLLSLKSFWIRKCEYNGYLSDHQDVLKRLTVDLKKVCVLRTFENNLIDVHLFSSGLEVVSSFTHEEPPVLMSSHKAPDFEDTVIDKCLASDYKWCTKRMEIDLIAMGLDAETLDRLRPAITVSEYVSNRADCAAIYGMSVRLLGENAEISEETFWQGTKEWAQWEAQRWTKIEHTFRNYPAGVRRIILLCKGKDKQFWAGNYGAKMARCSVVVHLDFNPPSATSAPPAQQDDN